MSTARLLQSYFAAKVSVSPLVTIIGPAFRGLWRGTGNDRFAQHAPLSFLNLPFGGCQRAPVADHAPMRKSLYCPDWRSGALMTRTALACCTALALVWAAPAAAQRFEKCGLAYGTTCPFDL